MKSSSCILVVVACATLPLLRASLAFAADTPVAAPEPPPPPSAPAPALDPVPPPAATPPPVKAPAVDEGDEDSEPSPREEKSETNYWPSLLLEPGAGAVVAPAARGAGTFGFSVGVVRLSLKGSSRVSSLFALHTGYTLAPGVDRGELTLTAGTGITGPWVLALRGGPTIDTNGNYGFRAGLRGTLYHAIGFEAFAHHAFSPRNDTSVFVVMTVDLVPATLAVLFIGAMSNLFSK